MANENMNMSPEGLAALRVSEGAVLHYYNDLANNCTFGIGTLAHSGPCTTEELQRRVSEQQVNAQLEGRVRTAEATVRNGVPTFQLTQGQFDALVSFAYNVGAGGAATALAAANRGQTGDVAVQMNARVYVHHRDAQGHRGPPVRVQGLVNRRQREAAPFVGQPPQQR